MESKINKGVLPIRVAILTALGAGVGMVLPNSASAQLQQESAELLTSSVRASLPQQTATPVGTTSAGTEPGVEALETIIVQGFGFHQEIAKTAGSIAVLRSDDIEAMNLTELSELNARVPGVTLVSSLTGGPKYPYIRGIGKFSEIFGRSVAVNIDGIPQSLVELQNPAISGDVERIEVLKGPQQILNGHNGLSGAINIFTRQPQESEGTLGFGLGSDGYVNTNARYHHVFNEEFSLSGAFSMNTDDGWLTNVRTGNTTADRDRKNFSLTGIFTPTDQTRIVANAYGYNYRESGPLLVTVNPQTMRPYQHYNSYVGVIGEELDFGELSHDTDDFTYSQVRGASVDIRHDLNGVEFQSTTGWTSYRDNGLLDVDGGDHPLLQSEMSTSQDNHLLSQNLRFSSNTDADLQWIAGVDGYYNRYDSTKLILGMGDIDYGTNQTQQGVGIYGQMPWSLNEKFDLRLGARYQIDKTYGVGKGFQDGESLSVTDKTLLLSGVATWHLNDQSLVYGSVAQSYYPTGIYVIDQLSTYHKEEGVTAELGFKGRWFDDRLYTSVALYESRSSNPVYTLASPYSVWSVDQQRNRGFEAEVNLRVTPELEVGASYSRSDPVITRWDDHPELEGVRPMQVPLSQANVNATYRRHFPIGSVTSRIDVNHMGSHYGDNANTYKARGYTLADLSVGLERGPHALTIWSKNIFNKQYYSLVSWTNQFEAQAAYGRGRSVGINYSLKF